MKPLNNILSCFRFWISDSRFPNLVFILIITSAIFSGCNPRAGISEETPTRGKIKISVDESYKPMIDAEIDVFQSLYKYAHITPAYKPENDLFSDFFKDSVQTIVTSRILTKEEEEGLKSRQIIPRTTHIAYDALTFIIHTKNTDTTLRYSQVSDIFAGKITQWDQINKNSKPEKITVVFDNPKSSNARFIREEFNLSTQFPSICFAVKTNEEVINYVEKNPNALGIISVNWISDNDDSLTNNFLKRVKVVAISSKLDPEGSGYYYRPYPAYIADDSYPFIRKVYIIRRETFSGLGSGFNNFVAGEKGQRIILKEGMVPATMPVRLIELK